MTGSSAVRALTQVFQPPVRRFSELTIQPCCSQAYKGSAKFGLQAIRTQLKCRLIASRYGKGLITEAEFMEKLSAERAGYQKMFKKVK